MSCKYCGKSFENPHSLGGHLIHCKMNPTRTGKCGYAIHQKAQKEAEEIPGECRFCGSSKKNKMSLVQHEIRCKSNPDRIKLDNVGPKNGMFGKKGANQFTKNCDSVTSDETRAKLSAAFKGRKQSEEFKKKISEGMKRAHANGKAWNIGMSRWKNEPSWPEKFFMQVIENEFDDKEYVREFPVGIFSCDFAWIHKKKCIEIDGEQHQRHQDVIERDERKNIRLLAEGWQVMRIPWSSFYNDTKSWIARAKQFVSS